MRREFSALVKSTIAKDTKSVFLTGDLGFNALEEVREIMGDRFINAGVAEQSMVSIASGIAKEGFQVFCYSIAPFITFRCLEQIRNDVCFHDLPVYLIGNGGGYGYGIMGSSHHAIEDIAVLSGLPNMNCYVPSFKEDVETCFLEMTQQKKPAYLRLGLAKPNNFENKPAGLFSKVTNNTNSKLTIAVSGPVINNVYDAIHNLGYTDKVDVFNITKIPYSKLSSEFIYSIRVTKKLLVIEEHISIGGIGQQIAHDILSAGIPLSFFKTLFAKGYPDSLYGSQPYHLKKSGLDIENISSIIKQQI